METEKSCFDKVDSKSAATHITPGTQTVRHLHVLHYSFSLQSGSILSWQYLLWSFSFFSFLPLFYNYKIQLYSRNAISGFISVNQILSKSAYQTSTLEISPPMLLSRNWTDRVSMNKRLLWVDLRVFFLRCRENPHGTHIFHLPI